MHGRPLEAVALHEQRDEKNRANREKQCFAAQVAQPSPGWDPSGFENNPNVCEVFSQPEACGL